jgi:hypothetical protein
MPYDHLIDIGGIGFHDPSSISETALLQQLGILFTPQLPATALAHRCFAGPWIGTRWRAPLLTIIIVIVS